MINTQILLGLRLFYFILNLSPLVHEVTCFRLYVGGKNMRRKCQMSNLQKKMLSNLTCVLIGIPEKWDPGP